MATYTGDDTNNTVIGSDENDTISGLGGNDNLNGGLGDDVIDGGAGSDLLIGGPGHDTLTGGTGADFFQDTAANFNGDIITDFHIGDHIQFTDTSLNTDNAGISVNGTVLSYTGGSIDLSNLGAGRFVVRNLVGGGVDVRLQEAAHNDFNGDGHSDILWRSDNGRMTSWLGQPDGSLAYTAVSDTTAVPTSVHIAGTGDFNGDGIDDILWRAADGTMTDWLGQAGGSFAYNPASYTWIPTDWHIAGTGDFNGDGGSDILWRADDGTMTNWLGQPDGSFAYNPASYTTTVPTSVHIADIGDFNGDAIDDILWRAADGTMTNWLGQTDGSFAYNAASYTQIPTDWHIQSPFTHDALF